ncbi:MAG TPA: fibronectin type III domain-containing protein [Candidatus Marinimicrobia bacterium]|nr:fibronectin type III domain-containing protein [Candidatus Neomarinimicrobiota bacterium]
MKFQQLTRNLFLVVVIAIGLTNVRGQDGGTAALSYSFDNTTGDPLVSTWTTGSGQINISDNYSIFKEGHAALQSEWTINHGDDWGGKASIEYKKTAPVGEYFDVSRADYLTIWFYNTIPASQSEKTFFEFNLLDVGGDAVYDGTPNSTEQWLYWKSGVFDMQPGWNQIRMPLVNRGIANPNDQGFSAPGWNGVANNGILDKDRIVGWQINIQTENTSLGDIVSGTTLFDQLQVEKGGGSSEVPSAPFALRAMAVSASQIDLSWIDNSDNEEGFIIERSMDGGITFMQITNVRANTTTYQDQGLAASTQYFYRVQAYNVYGYSDYSNYAMAMTQGGGGGTAALSYSFDNTTGDPLVSSWATGSGQINLSDNYSIVKEGRAALQVEWQIVHENEWGGNGTINYTKTAPVGEYFDVSGADYLTLWVYNSVPASQSGRTLFEFHLLEAGGDVAYDGTCNSAEYWYFRKSGVFDLQPGWNQIRMPLVDRGAEFPNDQGFSAVGWNGVNNNGILDKDRIVGWQIVIQTENTTMGDFVSGTTLFDQLQVEKGGSSEVPSAPFALRAMAVSASQIDLSWIDNSDNEEGFIIERSMDGGITFMQITNVRANTTTYQDQGLAASTQYFYRVQAYNVYGYSDYSNYAMAMTQGGGGGTAALSYSFDNTTADPLVSSWATGSGKIGLSDNYSIVKEGHAALQSEWTINHGDDWGGNSGIEYKKTAPVGEYFDVSGADYLTLWVYNSVPASQSERTLFEFHLLEAGGDAAYDGTTNSAEQWLYRKSGVFDLQAGWNQIRMPLVDRGIANPNDQGFSAPGWNGVANNGILDKDRIVGWQINIQTENTSLGDIVSGTTLFDQLQVEKGGGSSEVPSAPYPLRAMAVSASQIDLSWNDNSDNEEGFIIERSMDGGKTFMQITNVRANTTTYQDQGLAASTQYFYRVQAYNVYGYSDYSNYAMAMTQGGGGGTAALSYSFDNTTGDPLVSSWATGSGQINLSDNYSIVKEGRAALQVEWTINHGDDWGGKASIEYKKTAPVGEYFDVSRADYLTIWFYNTIPASQSEKTFFEFNLLDVGGDAVYDGTPNSTEQWLYWKSGVFDMQPGWNQIRMPLVDRGAEFPNDQGFSAVGWNGVNNNGILDKDRIVGWQIVIQTENTTMGDFVRGTTLFDQLQTEPGSPVSEFTITFQADLTDFIANGWFDPANPADSIVVNGDFNGWDSHQKMLPSESNPNIYLFTTVVTGNPGDIVGWKFRLFPDSKWTNNGWESVENRELVIRGANIVLEPIKPVIYYRGNPITQDVTVTFTVDMSGYEGIFSAVSLQGDAVPLNWVPGSLPMDDSDSDGIYTVDVLFPSGTGKTVGYKYTGLITLPAGTVWVWEGFEGNRSFEIDDSSPRQTLAVDIFNGYGPALNASVYLNGQKARLRVTDSSPINPAANPSAYIITGKAITVEAWVFPLNLPENGNSAVLVSRPYWNAEPWYAYELRINNLGPSDEPRFDFVVSDGNPGGAHNGVISTNPITIGEWTHLAGTYDGSNLRLYVNGELVSQGPFTANIGPGDAGFYLGGTWNNYFDGVIDEVRLWNVSRSQEEIQNVMNQQLVGDEVGLVGYWPLDQDVEVNGSYPVCVDKTANHNDLLMQNGARIVSAYAPSVEPEIAPEFQAQELFGVANVNFSYRPLCSGWPKPTLTLVTGPRGLIINGEWVYWTPTTAGHYWFVLEARNSAGVTQGNYHIWVDSIRVSTDTHNNNNVLLSVYNNGFVGNTLPDLNGNGFQYNGTNGLFIGSLIIAQSANQVSGKLYNNEFGTLEQVHSVGSLLTGFDQAFESRFNDTRKLNPIGVEVVQRTHSKSTNPDQNYVLVEYEIYNKSGRQLTDLYIGLGMDWDVGSNATQNYAGYDAEKRLSYAFLNDETPYFGMTALTGNVSGYRTWLANSGEDENADVFLYRAMTQFSDLPSSAGDIRNVLGTGPYTIPVNGSITAVFALLAGDNLADLRVNADAAVAVDLGGEIPVLSHFAPVYTGNPYLAMNIYITDATIDGVTLGVGDEIGIFDGELCVGAGVVTGSIAPYLPLVAATDDPTTPEKDGFTSGHTISYRLWNRDQCLEITSVQATYTQGVGIFSSQGTAVVSLAGSHSVSQTIALDLGWNIVSFYSIPANPDMLNIFQNLVSNNSLIKIQNETGNAVEKLGAIGWVNNIGNMAATEGYYVKVASNQTLTIEGNGVTLPLEIPLNTGWNIMSYPATSAQNALNVIQSLIDNNKLQKVQDEVGNAIEKLPVIGWVNNIGNFEPGEGYYIKVNSTASVTVNQPAKAPLAKSQMAPLAVSPSHYLPITETNPYLPMNVYVMSANVEGEPLKTGAEIAIYHQNQCITAAALPYPLNTENAYLPLIIGADDPLSEEIEGFNENDPISFKIWDGNEELLVSAKAVKYEDNAGILKFNAHGTIVVELEAQRIPKEYSLHQNYPNPFNPTTTLRYDLPKPGKVEIRIFDLQGRLVNQLVSEYQEVGKYSVVWNGCDSHGVPVPSGIYFYQLNTGSYSKTRKAILMK